jgi:adhesin transport system membrane fusion protein
MAHSAPKPAKPHAAAPPRNQMRHLSRDAVLEEMGPSRLGALSLVLIAVLIVGAVVWSAFVTVTTAATVEGEIVPSGDARIVEHLEGGIVSDILVADGDLVRAGDVLLRLDPIQRGAELGQMRAREAALYIRELRLRAQIDGAEPDFGDLEADYPDLVEEARVTLLAVRARIEGETAVLRSVVEQRRRAVDLLRNQAGNLSEQRRLLRETVAMREELFKSGHGSRVNLINAQLDLARVEGEIADARVSAEQAEIAIQESLNQIQELVVTERNDALESLSGVLGELAEVRQNLARLQDRFSRLDVRAPIDGVVHELAVNTPGAVVEPGDRLVTLIPIGVSLLVEARIAPKDIGHVAVGQETEVTVSGFDARRYGGVPGRLQAISPTSILNEEGDPYYKGTIVLDAGSIEANGAVIRLIPGMTVSADIVTDHQTLLQYLTGPIHSAVSRAFSER